jgi:hypothetical protein
VWRARGQHRTFREGVGDVAAERQLLHPAGQGGCGWRL